MKQRLSVASSNFTNAETTRTPDGGPYRKKIVRDCAKGRCWIIELSRFREIKNPSHPDADARGMVRYPDINRDEERASVDRWAHRLIALARQKTCGVKLFINKHDAHMLLLTYPDDELKDKFTLEQNRVVSWSIESPYGKDSISFR